MADGDFKDQPRRTTSDKLLRDKAFEIASNLNYNGYQRRIASMFYKIFEEKTRVHVRDKESLRTKKSGNKLSRPMTRKIQRHKALVLRSCR